MPYLRYMKRNTFLKGLLAVSLLAIPTVAVAQTLMPPTANAKGVRYDLNETNDCSVLALSIAYDAKYTTVHRLLKQMDVREDRQGVHLSKLSVNMHSISQTLNGHAFPMMGYEESISLSEFAETYKEGRYLVVVDGHIVCVKDGVVYDANRKYYHKEVKAVWIAVVKAQPLNSYTY